MADGTRIKESQLIDLEKQEETNLFKILILGLIDYSIVITSPDAIRALNKGVEAVDAGIYVYDLDTDTIELIFTASDDVD